MEEMLIFKCQHHFAMDNPTIVQLMILIGLLVQQLLASHPRLLYRHRDARAQKRFCAQQQFNGVSFDGELYKFFSHRALPGTEPCCPKYIWEEFRLKYDSEKNTFSYNSFLYDYENTVPMTGMYVNIMDTYIELYSNKYRSKSLFSCSFPNITGCHTNGLLDQCDPASMKSFNDWHLNKCHSQKITQQLYENSFTKSLLYSQEFSLARKKAPTFASLFDGQRIVFLFPDRKEPSSVNSLRLNYESIPNSTYWFLKPFDNATEHEIIGTIPWKSSGQTTFFAIVNWFWEPSDVRIIPLIKNNKLSLTKQNILMKTFFGCPDHLRSSPNSHRRFDSISNEKKSLSIPAKNIPETTRAAEISDKGQRRETFVKSISTVPSSSSKSSFSDYDSGFSTIYTVAIFTTLFVFFSLILYGTFSHFQKRFRFGTAHETPLFYRSKTPE